jgi:TolA-binding protein
MRLGMAAGLMALALAGQPSPAHAQMDSREAIALQNQVLQLRQEVEQLRARGGAVSPPAPSARSGGAGNEMIGQLLDRVTTLEEETRRLRGRVDEAENRDRRLAADVQKLTEDMEYRLQRVEGGAAAARPAAPAAPAAPPAAVARPAAPTAPVAPVVPPPAAATPRTAERALSDGQAALARRDYPAAEAAAREALATRGGTQQANAQLLLGDALSGKRDWGNAAIAYNEAYTRARTSPRAPEALLGLAGAFQGLGSRREACDTLNDLRSNHPNLSAALQERATAARARAQCR